MYIKLPCYSPEIYTICQLYLRKGGKRRPREPSAGREIPDSGLQSCYTVSEWCFPACSAAASLHSCPTLCDPTDGSPPGSPVPGILQVRTLEWVAISFSNAWKWKVKVKSLSRVRFFATPWTAAYQAPPSMGFSRQEYWSGVPLPSPACLAGKGNRHKAPAPQKSLHINAEGRLTCAEQGMISDTAETNRTL